MKKEAEIRKILIALGFKKRKENTWWRWNLNEDIIFNETEIDKPTDIVDIIYFLGRKEVINDLKKYRNNIANLLSEQ